MSESTSRLGIPYPSKNAREWFDEWQAMMNSVDSNLFGLLDGRNVFESGGGVISWNVPTLDWSESLGFVSPTFGKVATVSVGSISVADGEFVFVVLSPGLTADTTTSLLTATRVPVDIGARVFAYRSGDVLYFTKGLSLSDTETNEVEVVILTGAVIDMTGTQVIGVEYGAIEIDAVETVPTTIEDPQEVP